MTDEKDLYVFVVVRKYRNRFLDWLFGGKRTWFEQCSADRASEIAIGIALRPSSVGVAHRIATEADIQVVKSAK